MSDARYDVLTWDPVLETFTEQAGMESPCLGVSLAGVRRALHELRRDWGYTAHRVRDRTGSHHSDPAVLVERTDDTPESKNLRDIFIPPMTDEEFDQQVKLVQYGQVPWPCFAIIERSDRSDRE